MNPLSLGLLLVASSLCACSGSDTGGAPTLTVRDSSGVTIVENGDLGLRSGLQAAAVPSVEIGVIDGPEELQLFRVSAAKRLADGGLAVTNGGTRELRIYDADGTHRATAGGSGQGPSEFGYPIGIQVRGRDTILVQDRYDRVYFTADGQFVRRVTTDRQAMTDLFLGAGGFSEGGQWLADGTFFAPVYARDAGPPTAGPPFRPSMTFVRVASDLSSLDVLDTFGGILQQYVDVGEERPSATVPPFAANTSWGLGSADGTIVAADNAAPQIDLFRPDGSRTIARWTEPREPIAGPEVEEWKDRQRASSWTQSRLPQLERAWAAMDLPDHKPFYGRAGTGSDGRTWLAPVEGGGSAWTVVGIDGEASTVAGLPGSFSVMDSGPGWVLGVFRDEQEVEFLRLYDVEMARTATPGPTDGQNSP